MGRKKKIKVVEQTPILYSGTVVVKKLRKDKVISTKTYHNTGTPVLFNFLLNCLAGNYLATARPSWVTTGINDTGTIKWVSNNRVNISQPPEVKQTPDKSYVEYKFLLPNRPEYRKGFDCLIIYNSDNLPSEITTGQIVSNNYSMLVNLGEVVTSLDTEEQLLIIWQLEIKNPE